MDEQPDEERLAFVDTDHEGNNMSLSTVAIATMPSSLLALLVVAAVVEVVISKELDSAIVFFTPAVDSWINESTRLNSDWSMSIDSLSNVSS